MTFSAVSFDSDGHAWFVGQQMHRVQEIYEWDLASAPVSKTAINEAFAKVPLLAPEFVRYASFDGRSIEGALLLPGGKRPVAPMRTVVLIHGGPTGAWRDTFETWGQLLAARGYAVFYPNVRGSTGYGHDFIEMNRGDWGGGDFKDVMAGVDWLVKRAHRRSGEARHRRLVLRRLHGVVGDHADAPLQGGGLGRAACRPGQRVRHRGRLRVRRVVLRHAVREADGFIKSSPMTYITNAKTPTLMLQGEDDVIDPIGQSRRSIAR